MLIWLRCLLKQNGFNMTSSFSILSDRLQSCYTKLRGHVAQRIEHQIPVLGVAGSTPAMLVLISYRMVVPCLGLISELGGKFLSSKAGDEMSRQFGVVPQNNAAKQRVGGIRRIAISAERLYEMHSQIWYMTPLILVVMGRCRIGSGSHLQTVVLIWEYSLLASKQYGIEDSARF